MEQNAKNSDSELSWSDYDDGSLGAGFQSPIVDNSVLELYVFDTVGSHVDHFIMTWSEFWYDFSHTVGMVGTEIDRMRHAIFDNAAPGVDVDVTSLINVKYIDDDGDVQIRVRVNRPTSENDTWANALAIYATEKRDET